MIFNGFFNNFNLLKKDGIDISHFLDITFNISPYYQEVKLSEDSKNFYKHLSEYNIKNIFVDYIHPSYYSAISSAFHDSYELCPALYNKPLEAFGLEENYDFSEDNKIVVGRFVLFHKNDKDKIDYLTRSIALNVRVYNKDIKDRHVDNKKICGMQLSPDVESKHTVCHEIAHSLLQMVADDYLPFTLEQMNNSENNREEYVMKNDNKRVDIAYECLSKAMEKMFMPNTVVKNASKLLTEYSGKNEEEFFCESFGDFLSNKYPSPVSVNIVKAFAELYPDYINKDVLESRLEEINNNLENLPFEYKTHRAEIITNLRMKSTPDQLAKDVVNCLCVNGRFEGPYGKEFNDACIYFKTLNCFYAPNSGRMRNNQKEVAHLMEVSDVFNESHSNTRTAIAWAAKSSLEASAIRNYRKHEIKEILEYNYFINKEKSPSLDAAIKVFNNFSNNEGVILALFPFDGSGNGDISWTDGCIFLRENISMFSSEDIKILNDNLLTIANYQHTPADNYAITEMKEILTNNLQQISQNKETER